MALEFAKAGATVVAVARDADKLAALVDEINSAGGPTATFHTCDVTDPAAVDRVFGQIVDRHESVQVARNLHAGEVGFAGCRVR